jgi:hypothetical protein
MTPSITAYQRLERMRKSFAKSRGERREYGNASQPDKHALFEALQRQSPSGLPFPRSVAFGLVFALRELIHERILDIEDNAA